VPRYNPKDFSGLTATAKGGAVDKPAFSGMVQEGARSLGLAVTGPAADALAWLTGELVRWSARFNLTAILDPIEIADKHIFDSLAVIRVLDPADRTVLDAGTGAGFPGLPLAIANPDLELTLVDSVAKKVGFVKHAIATLGLGSRVRALHSTLAGRPEEEGLGQFDVAVSRALAEPERWASLGRPYLRPGGTLVVMAGGASPSVARPGWEGPRVDRFKLPLTGADRALLTYRRI
jgi:16S rRNA (guanine527-N7)-methyltransferase